MQRQFLFSISFILSIFHLYLKIKWQYIMTWHNGIMKLWQVMKGNIHTYWSLIICKVKKNVTLFLQCILVLLTLMWPFEKSSYDFMIRCLLLCWSGNCRNAVLCLHNRKLNCFSLIDNYGNYFHFVSNQHNFD